MRIGDIAMSVVALPQVAPEPITSVVLKVAAGCNLDCTYCYEYKHGDESWRRKPASVGDEVVRTLGRRIRDHVRAAGLTHFDVSLHGGEPMLLGAERLAAIAHMIRTEVADTVELHFGMQTNATLLDDDAVATLSAAGIMIGVSLDGLPATNNRFRPDKRGEGTHARAVRGIECIRRVAPGHFGGILAVIDVDADPRATFEHLASFCPPVLDFLLPHGTWDRLPPGKASPAGIRHGQWLADVFDAWFDGPHRKVSVRYLESILSIMMGGRSTTEAVGPEPVTLVTVATDGCIEAVDTMKSVYPGAQELGIRLDAADFEAARRDAHVRLRQAGVAGLCGTCQSCPEVRVCGGGYFPHRFGRGQGFNNPSVYCADILHLCSHIRHRVRSLVRSRP